MFSLLLVIVFALSTQVLGETKRETEMRTKAWQDARFGMFIHWDVSSLYNNGQGGEISWVRPGKKPLDVYGDPVGADFVPAYDTLYRKFNPTKFNATQFVQIAKNAGIRYIVPTAKHHDGFAMWFTKQKNSRDPAPYSLELTPWKQDYIKLLSDACHAAAMPIGIYYSPRDWYNPDYGVGSNSVYEAFMQGQIRELVTNYGKINLMWWDSYGKLKPLSRS